MYSPSNLRRPSSVISETFSESVGICCNSIRPSSSLAFKIPGTSSKAFRRPLRSIPNRLDTSPAVFPRTKRHSISGECPRLSRTDETREILPLAKSRLTLTLPSVAETKTSVVPGNRLTARVAFIAQSGQSIPRICHSNCSIPSTANSASIKSAASAPSPAIGLTSSREPSSRTNSSTDSAFAIFFLPAPEILERILLTPSPSNPCIPEIALPSEPIVAELSLPD